jgi:hypothetical protein
LKIPQKAGLFEHPREIFQGKIFGKKSWRKNKYFLQGFERGGNHPEKGKCR